MAWEEEGGYRPKCVLLLHELQFEIARRAGDGRGVCSLIARTLIFEDVTHEHIFEIARRPVRGRVPPGSPIPGNGRCVLMLGEKGCGIRNSQAWSIATLLARSIAE